MLIALGSIFAVVVLADAVRTVINLTEQKGPIARTVHRVGRRFARMLPDGLRASAGLAITAAIVTSWTLGLWLAWTIALSDPAVSVQTSVGDPADGVLDALYLAGFSIFTLGTGDLSAGTTAGRLVTVVASATGLFTVSLEVTYLLSLTSASAHERSTARQAFALGHDVTTILERSWDGVSFRSAEPLLQSLARELSLLAEEHRTFPVLHDVLPRSRPLALGPSVLAVLDAIEIMHRAVPRDAALTVLTYEQVTQAVDGLLAGLPAGSVPPEPPSPVDPAGLLSSIGCTPTGGIAHDARHDERRRGLFGLAIEEGWRDAAIAAVHPRYTS